MIKKGDLIRQLATNKWKLNLFFLKQLPLGFWVGLKLITVNNNEAVVSVPFKYVNKNPFRSTYFSVLSMAAELSTGVLAMASVYDAEVPVSMLLLKMDAEFLKKATTKVFFKCSDGQSIEDTVKKSITNNQGETIRVYSEGFDINDNLIAKFQFVWSFKPKE